MVDQNPDKKGESTVETPCLHNSVDISSINTIERAPAAPAPHRYSVTEYRAALELGRDYAGLCGTKTTFLIQ